MRSISALVKAVPRGFIPPLRYGVADFCRNGAGLSVVEVEIPRDLKGEREGSGVVILVDRGAEDAWLDVGRHRVQVVGRRQPPARRTVVKKYGPTAAPLGA
jgi:hypothetical protein